MVNLPYPNNAPRGTPFEFVWTGFRNSIWLGLYSGSPQLCPPAAYSTLQQPTWGGYTLQGAEDWKLLASIPGQDIALQRFLAYFPVANIASPQTVSGWFAACLFSDGTYETMGIFPFGSTLLLSSIGQSVLLNGEVSSGPSGQPGGASLQNVTSVQAVLTGGRMANLFRREQRACINTAVTALEKLELWDSEVPRPSGPPPAPTYRGVLANTKIVPNQAPPSVTTIPNNAYATMTSLLIAWLKSQNLIVVPNQHP